MERRCHPTHDRHTIRQLTFVAVSLLSIFGLALVEHYLEVNWVFYLIIGLFTATLLEVSRFKINTTTCPLCEAKLRRPPDTTEFACEPCQIIWNTKSFGYSAFE
jgi:nitrate reductase NapE component